MTHRSRILAIACVDSLVSVLMILHFRPPAVLPTVATVPNQPSTSSTAFSTTQRPAPSQHNGNKFDDLAALSAVPIEFYERVIDQDGQPLPGVKVIGGTGSTMSFMHQETRTYTTSTDANGLFSLAGFRGDALVIDLKKAEYNFASERNRFHYSPIDPDNRRFSPNRNNPIVFQMWKAIGPEPLISYYGQSVRIPTNGRPVMIDLENGTEANGEEDLLVSVTWGARPQKDSYAFEWSAKFEVPSGGILESAGDTMFMAPAEGYQRTLEYHFSAQDKEGSLERTFYIKSRNGTTFSRAKISVGNDPRQGDATVTLRVQLNPRPGSRNLEPPTYRPVAVPKA